MIYIYNGGDTDIGSTRASLADDGANEYKFPRGTALYYDFSDGHLNVAILEAQFLNSLCKLLIRV